MLNSLFYLVMLIGVGWLMIWAILPPEQRAKGWWPFDMRDEAPPEAQDEAAAVMRPGRMSARTRERDPGPGAAGNGQGPGREAQAPAAPASWRTRRDRALSSRRGA
jgi:hypothetical protein